MQICKQCYEESGRLVPIEYKMFDNFGTLEERPKCLKEDDHNICGDYDASYMSEDDIIDAPEELYMIDILKSIDKDGGENIEFFDIFDKNGIVNYLKNKKGQISVKNLNPIIKDSVNGDSYFGGIYLEEIDDKYVVNYDDGGWLLDINSIIKPGTKVKQFEVKTFIDIITKKGYEEIVSLFK